MFDMKKKLLTVAVATALAACSGGNDSVGTTTGTGVSTVVSGTAAKGIIVNGLIEAFPVTAGVIGTTALVAQNAPVGTNSLGEYSLALPVDYSGPVKIQISATTDTTMKCDLPSGCGTAAFGQDVALESDFVMSALVDVPTGEEAVTTPVTPLTHIAAKLVEAGSAVSATEIAKANSHIANLLEVDSIVDLPVVDLTNPTAFNSADTATQEAALANAALMEAILSGGGATNLSDAMDTLVQSLDLESSVPGQLVSRDDNEGAFILSLTDVIEQQRTVLDAVEQHASDNSVVLEITELSGGLTQALAEVSSLPVDDNARTEAKPSPEADKTDLEKAKALVKDVRDLIYSSGVMPALSNDLSLGLNKFEDQLRTAAGNLSDDTQSMIEALNWLAEVYSEEETLFLAALDGSTLTEYETVNTDRGFTTQNADADGFYVTAVKHTRPDGAVLDLTLKIKAQGAKTEGFLSGTVDTDGALLTIKDGGKFDLKEKTPETAATEIVEFTLKGVAATLSQKADPKNSFDGSMTMLLTNFHDAEGQWKNDYAKADKLDLILSGAFSSNNSDTFSGASSFSFDASSMDGNSAFWSKLGQNISLQNIESLLPLTGESAGAFVTATSGLSFETQLEGLSDNAAVEMRSVRNELNNAGVSLQLSYNAKQITYFLNTNDSNTLRITNQDNVEIQLKNSDSDVLSGTVTVGGKQFATISEMSGNLIKVAYTDGYNETLQ
ncbi:MAG: hypothetical protein ACPGF7_07130 [Pontibacterium sp.]